MLGSRSILYFCSPIQHGYDIRYNTVAHVVNSISIQVDKSTQDKQKLPAHCEMYLGRSHV